METLVRGIDFTSARGESARELLRREWLATNGLGGYASGTISGAVTWRYHGLLIAALPAPLGRMLMLNHLAESLVCGDGRVIQFGGYEPAHSPQKTFSNFLVEFRLENPLPIWRYAVDGIEIEKRVAMLYLQNTVHITYRLL